jgi:hypothetical protein
VFFSLTGGRIEEDDESIDRDASAASEAERSELEGVKA